MSARVTAVRLLATLLAVVGGFVLDVGTGAASPYPVTPGNDPTDAANCTQHGTDGDGDVSWCRHRGVMATPVSGVGARWAGNYAVVVGDEVDYVWCLDDSGSHPRVVYEPGDIVSAAALIDELYGGAAHPEHLAVIPVAMGLIGDGEFVGTLAIPGYTEQFDGATLAAAVWAIQHYVVGDRSDSGTVVVASPHLWSTDPILNLATDQLWAYAVRATDFRIAIGHAPVDEAGNVDVTITQTTGTPPSMVATQITEVALDGATNLEWRTTGAAVTPTYITAGTPSPDLTVIEGVVTMHMRLTDRTRPGTITASRLWTDETSWMAFPATGGQQSTGVYFAPNNVAHHVSDTVEAVHIPPGAVHGRKVDDRGMALAGASFRLDCGDGVVADTTTGSDGGWSFTAIPMDIGVVPKSCTVSETTVPAGVSGPAAPTSFSLRPGEDLDLGGSPIVNTWRREFTSMAGSSLALPGDTATEFAYARNLSLGEQLTVTGVGYWLADGTAVPSAAPATADVQLGSWSLTGAGTTEVVAGQPWTLPPDHECGGWQIVLTFTSADGTVLGTEGWGNAAQHVDVPCVRTVVDKITLAGAGIADDGTARGIPTAGPGETVTATVALPLVRHRGDCTNPTIVATGSVTLSGNGAFRSDVVAVGEPGWAYTFVEALTVTKTHATTPHGWSTRLPGSSGAETTDTVTTVPETCSPDETTFVPAGSTQINDQAIVDGANVSDALLASGIPTGTADRPAVIAADGSITWGGWRFEIVARGILHRWPSGSVPDCSGPALTTFTMPVTGNGLLTGLGSYTATASDSGSDLGWLDQLDATVTNISTGASTSTVIALAPCGEVTETGRFAAPPPPPPGPAAQVQAIGTLPATGGNGALVVGVALIVVGLGVLCLALPRRRQPARESVNNVPAAFGVHP